MCIDLRVCSHTELALQDITIAIISIMIINNIIIICVLINSVPTITDITSMIELLLIL